MGAHYCAHCTFSDVWDSHNKNTSELSSNNPSKRKERESLINNHPRGTGCVRMRFLPLAGGDLRNKLGWRSWKWPWVHQHLQRDCELASFPTSLTFAFRHYPTVKSLHRYSHPSSHSLQCSAMVKFKQQGWGGWWALLPNLFYIMAFKKLAIYRQEWRQLGEAAHWWAQYPGMPGSHLKCCHPQAVKLWATESENHGDKLNTYGEVRLSEPRANTRQLCGPVLRDISRGQIPAWTPSHIYHICLCWRYTKGQSF